MSEESLPYGESPDAAESVDFAERVELEQRLLAAFNRLTLREAVRYKRVSRAL